MKGRNLLMIPGPIEFTHEVLEAMGRPTDSHVSPAFINIFGEALEMMRSVWLAPSGQPFILAGSGTLAMDSIGANLVEPGDRVLVISTGYFGDRYADLLSRYGAEVKILSAPLGNVVDIIEIENELSTGNYSMLTFTHVDTSTAVKVDPVPIGRLGLKYNVLTVLDGVCSVAGEEIRQEEWGIDAVLSASQKAIGVPPGLALFVVSKRAMEKWKSRKSPVLNYYSDWNNWLPVMEAYEERRPSYFGTPAVNLVEALNVSLTEILAEGLKNRFSRHNATGEAVRAALKALGLKYVPVSDSIAANTLSAPFYPDNTEPHKLLSAIGRAGVVLAGGLHPLNKMKYFRIGHMGAVSRNDLVSTISAIEQGLIECGYEITAGQGVKALVDVLNKRN